MTENTDSQPAQELDSPALDIDRVNADDWPARDFPIDDGRRENSVRVVIKQSVLNDIHRHGQTTTDVEICGVLIGAGYRDERGPFVYVEANIRGDHSDSKAAQVTFTGETWNHIHNELDRDYPDLQILGWYHTHPGFGIFLSGMDLFIHENYFSGEQQLALVYDPIGGDEGLFVWRGGKAVRDGFLIEPDAEEDPPPVAAGPPSEPMTAGAAMTDDGPDALPETTSAAALQARVERMEKRQTFTDLGVFSAIMLSIAVPMLMWLLWIEPRLPPAASPGSHERPPSRTVVPPKPNPPDEPTSDDASNDEAEDENSANDDTTSDGAEDADGTDHSNKDEVAPD